MSNPRNRRFELLVLPHLGAGLTLARWLMRGPEDGEDALQEALIRALRHIESCRDASAKSWFLRITRNVCYDLLTARSQLRQDHFADLDPEDPEGSGFVEDVFGRRAENPETALSDKGVHEALNRAIADLPAQFREAVVLRDIEGLSYAEIAQVTGVALGTVMSRLSRGRDQLMKELRKDHG